MQGKLEIKKYGNNSIIVCRGIYILGNVYLDDSNEYCYEELSVSELREIADFCEQQTKEKTDVL